MKSHRIKISVVAALIAASVGVPAVFAQQPTIDQKLEDLQQQIKVLQQEREQDRAAATNAASQAAAPPPTTAYVKASQEGFYFMSDNGDFNLRIRGYAQADGRFFVGDKQTGTSTFLLRRARPIFEGTVFRDFDFRLMLDVGNGAASSTLLQDCYVEWKYFPWLKVRAGKFKPPVGLEQLQSDTDLFFVERGLPSDLLPQRDVGLQLSGNLFNGAVSYAGGIFNGVPDGGIADIDTDSDKDAAARIFVLPFWNTDIAPLKGFGFGAGGTAGDHPAADTLATYKSVGQQTIFSFLSITNAATAVKDGGQELRGTPQAYYYWGPLGVIGEYAISEQRIHTTTAGTEDLHTTAWQVEGGYFLTGETASYRASPYSEGLNPRHPFNLRSGGGFGAFELVARYGELHFDPNTFSTYADPTKSVSEAREWGLGVNWYLNRNIKVVTDYEQTVFDGGAGTSIAHKNRPAEQVVMSRVQFMF